MSKYRHEPVVSKSINRKVHEYPKGTTIYTWAFCHNKHGWCGGDDDDDWSERKHEMESRMDFCPYPTKLLRRVT